MIDRIYDKVRTVVHAIRKRKYLNGGRIPWADGYNAFRWAEIERYLKNPDILKKFREGSELPLNYGSRLDERIIEYPWLFSHLSPEELNTLDAGSVLNFRLLTEEIQSLQRQLTIFTLAPESIAFWKKRISYHYGDLRDMPFKDDYFDEIISISTLEHIGSDNVIYVEQIRKVNTKEQDFTVAGRELWRILKPGGNLYITVPYGLDETIYIDNTVFMRQFDRSLLQKLLECFPDGIIDTRFYKYSEIGWNISQQDDCDNLNYFNIHAGKTFDSDYAAAARSVCCIHIQRPI